MSGETAPMNIPFAGDPATLVALAGGFDVERDCFVAREERPAGMPLLTENGVTFKIGPVVVSGPVSPKCGRYECSPILHTQIEALRAALGCDPVVSVPGATT